MSQTPQQPDKAFWANDTAEWITAYLAAGLSRSEAMQVMCAQMMRPVFPEPQQIPPEMSEVYSKLATVIDRQLEEGSQE